MLTHYEQQSEEETVAENEASSRVADQTLMEVPNALVSTVRALIARHQGGMS